MDRRQRGGVRSAALAMTLVSVLAVGCAGQSGGAGGTVPAGSDDGANAADGGDMTADDSGGAPGGENPLTVEQALDHEGDGPVTVTGAAWSDGSATFLCSALLESFPPQCGSPSLPVKGLDLTGLGAQGEGDIAWAEGVQVTGRIVDGVLEVDTAS